MALSTPPLLEPYLRPPHETSLTLLTGVLGSSTNWLVQRYLGSLLAPQQPSSRSYSSSRYGEEPAEGAAAGVERCSVVFVSFLRDYAFWKDGCKRLGLDLDLAGKRGSFVFVDGLTGLFVSSSSDNELRQPAGAQTSDKSKRVLVAATTDHLRRTLEEALTHVQVSCPGTRIVLVVDQPDVLLAAAGDAISGQGLRDTILGLRERTHACIITVSADEPLIVTQGTPLEKEHASLALSLAHDARLVISLRMLDTGTAKDVSGVLRVTPGGDEETASTYIEDRELLYFIRGDGSVRVFERGQ
ncbi:hypothetical protein F5Y14DRAFT_458013 [Nemania sp. NC0429]|nr:hypothetical protein F5Y14DRAFT_458013 [Nemania sp. NC0429]